MNPILSTRLSDEAKGPQERAFRFVPILHPLFPLVVIEE